MLAASAGLTDVSFFNLRMRPEAFSPVKWRFAVWPRRIFPVAVTLKRLRTPRCVFNFIFGFDAFLGIAKTLSQSKEAGLTRPPLRAWNARPIATAAPLPVVLQASVLPRLFSAPAAPQERYLPCAASSQSVLDRQPRPADGPSWRGPLPGAPFRARGEKSSRALCGRRPESE